VISRPRVDFPSLAAVRRDSAVMVSPRGWRQA